MSEDGAGNILHRVYIGIGSNLGDRAKNIGEGLNMMLPDVRNMIVSELYETSASGFASQPRFLNAAACFWTKMDPYTTLDRINVIQKKISGRRIFVNGPRALDIDILLHGRTIIDSPGLVIPHPRMWERKFVLEPLMEIAPELKHPVERESVREALRNLDSDQWNCNTRKLQ